MYEALSIKLKTDVDASTSTASIVQYDDLSESSSSTPATSSTTSPSTSMIESSSPESEPKSPRAEPRCSIAESDCPITLSHSPNMKPESTEHHDDQDCDFPPTKRRKVPVEEMLTSLMTMDPPAQFELWRRMLQSHPFDLEQLNILKTIIKNRLKLDIVSSVPCEIAAYIMSFLSPRDLCQAAQTCRSWRIICDDNRLWRQKCSDEGLLNDRQILSVIMERHIAQKNVIQEKFASEYTSANVPKNHWKSAYSRHINILRNWNTREFHITEPVPADRPRQTALRTRPRPANVEARMVISAQLARLEQPIPQQQVARVRQAPVYRIYPLPNRPVERLQPQHQPQQQQLQDQPQAIAQPRPEQPAQESQQEAQPADSSKDQSIDNQNEARPCLMTLRCHEESVITCLQYNHETNILVSGSDDQTLKVWCSETGRCLSTLEGHQGGVWASQLSPDDMVISGSTDRTLRVWEARTGKLIHTLHGHTSTVRCLALCGDQVVSGSRDTTLRLWDIKQGRCLNVFLGHTAAVRCVEFKGDRIVSGAYDHLVMVWDATTGEMLHSLECHENRIYSLQYDGKIIASGSLDSTICIWDAKTGQLRHRLTGHSSLTSKMHLKGKILVSANADQTCKIWDIETGECLKTLENKHTSAVTSVFVNDWHVVTSSDDGTVRLWDIKTGEYLRDLVVLPSAVRGGVVWRIRASYTKLICAVGSRNTTPTDDTRLLVLDFK